jgi:hypothetical protein
MLNYKQKLLGADSRKEFFFSISEDQETAEDRVIEYYEFISHDSNDIKIK